MKITYSIQVCNESRELYSLINFLLNVKDTEDNIQVIVDSLHKTDKVQKVLDFFKDSILIYERPFDNFKDNTQFHADTAKGDYIFEIDADEMPQEFLIKKIKEIIEDTQSDLLWIPRINIHPGITDEQLKKFGFNLNEANWINWPDYQGRIWKKCDYIKWSDELHTKLQGAKKPVMLQANPKLALWHIKSMEKQQNRWKQDNSGNYNITSPSNDNLYDQLM